MSNYYLKTAVMLKIREGEVWSDTQLGEKFEKMLQVLQQHFQRKHLSSLHNPGLNLLGHTKSATLCNSERRLNRFIGADETVEIANKLSDVLNKSGKQQTTAKIELTAKWRTIVPDAVSDGNEWHSNGEVEDLLEEAFPYDYLEN